MSDVIQRNFFPGDQWVFFKFYTGNQLGNTMLLDSIYPKTIALFNDGIITNWHFVRYEDPEFHIRFRVCLNEISHSAAVTSGIIDAVKKYTVNHGLWDIQICTYKREVERYSPKYIFKAESIFTKQSIAAIKLINTSETPEEKFLSTAVNIYVNIEGFFEEIDDLINFYKSGQDAFFKEFSIGKEQKKELSKSYTHKQQNFKTQLHRKRNHSNDIDEKLIWSDDLLKDKGFNEYVKKHYLLSDLIHMFVNKVFIKDQRKNEAILYFYLFKITLFLKHRPF